MAFTSAEVAQMISPMSRKMEKTADKYLHTKTLLAYVFPKYNVVLN